MSVFGDFQRMWVQRFPQSSLSDAWEQDVRASLERHKQKIAVLSKELEQETLYVEYLERLLGDVEKYREAGGDPSTLFEANSPASAANLLAGGGQLRDSLPGHGDGAHEPDEEEVAAASNQSAAGAAPPTTDDADVAAGEQPSDPSVQLRSRELPPNRNNNSPLNQCINELTTNLHSRRCVSELVAASSSSSSTATSATTNPINAGEPAHQSTAAGGPAQQSTSNGPQPTANGGTPGHDVAGKEAAGRVRSASQSEAQQPLLASPSHFVTVIEVKESKGNGGSGASVGGASDKSPQDSETPSAPKTANYENVLINTGARFGGSVENLADLPYQQQQQPHTGGVNASTFLDSKHPKPPDRSSDGGGGGVGVGGSFTGGGSSISERTSQLLGASAAADHKKKVPPRPPPKYVRRAAPVEPPTVPSMAMQNLRNKDAGPIHSTPEPATGTAPDSPSVTSSSLERNIKPSEMYRQKSSDSLDVKLSSVGYGHDQPGKARLPKSDSLKSKSSSTDSPTGSLGKVASGTPGIGASPTGSLGKLPTSMTGSSSDSPTGSLGKMNQQQHHHHQTPPYTSQHSYQQRHGTDGGLPHVDSKESLASGGGGTGTIGSTGAIGPISERIKSYESISSLSSDSMRQQNPKDQEHYYDTVPLDNSDGDYVYIQPGGVGTGSTSSRDDISTVENASTLLMPSHPRSHNSSQTSVQLEPESPGRSSNYVNIEYFIHSSQNNENRSSSIDSDGEGDGGAPVLMRAISTDTDAGSGVVGTVGASPGVGTSSGSGLFRKVSNANRDTIIRRIVTSIITSETLYVECLNKMKQYMKAIRATLTTSQPVISEEEFQTIFFKIEDLHEVHSEFLTELQARLAAPDEPGSPDGGGLCVGEPFRRLATQIHLYGAFLHNYGRAIDTVKMCSTHSQQFKEIVSNIVFKNQNEQKLSLEELLHKPVARVQKNALVLEDLLNQTPEQHPDYHPLRQASKTIRNFLSEFNVVQTRSMFPVRSDDKALRRLVKNSFIVELADGHRKLRHLLLFNDVIACAKYKAVGRAGDRNGFEFELKWYIPLRDILICEESANDPKEASPINIVHLKSQACTVRDQIMLDEKDRPGGSSRAGDKHRKKLADLEAQLVLASPNLVFKIGNKATGKTMTFFLSSDFERTQWIESILSLQQSCNLPGHIPVQIYDLHAWITACQSLIKTEMGSYLMRNARDESLLVGDLHLTIQGLSGFDQPCDLFVCVEIDSYGHYFRKAKTKLVCRSATPQWNESFVLELEGSQNLRILLYQDDVQRPILRAKHILKLSRSWMQETPTRKVLQLSETLSISTIIRFVPGEVTLRRVPTSKPGALFGAKLQQVIKREKRDIPFIVSACVREVERRGMTEVGIYRVSGSASDVAKLKKSFETNAYEAEQLLKEVDIHSVTGILKSYLRDLPEALFTDQYYPKLFDAFNRHSNLSEGTRIHELQRIFAELPQPNKATINLLLDHLMRVHQQEIENKMSLHNLAMVFGPTLLRPGPSATKQKDLLESSTADVMTQAGILYSFLQARLK
ncbi:AGAP000865-PA [Anopheles gambiae str. PEST]|uniref:AGAP000865-PA n=1 Tax=Anopheles gambiae TaxID=7165 RepID=Q7Q4U7_ANOGA|nr:AGAP000865-PA [Anopheles gambiae str. PEST]